MPEIADFNNNASGSFCEVIETSIEALIIDALSCVCASAWVTAFSLGFSGELITSALGTPDSRTGMLDVIGSAST